MSKELVRTGQKYLATSDNGSLKKDAGSTMMQVGGGGLVLYGVSALPFISLPFLLVLAVLLGGYLYVK